jgi:nucleoside-diphosphate-sugar epimerase
MKTNQHVLVTGACGYIGSLLSNKLLNAGYNITLLDNRINDNKDLQHIIGHRQVKVLEGDIRDKNSISNAVAGVDTIVHLAAISDGNMGRLNPLITREVNYESLVYMIELAKSSGVKRFLFSSTFGVYGKSYNQILEESLKLNPEDPYSETKSLCEELLVKNNSNNFTTTSLRIAMVYGLAPSMRYEFLVNRMSLTAKNSGKLEIMGGGQRRPQIHIQDISDYFCRLVSIEKELISGQSFNAVGENPSILEIATSIKSYMANVEITMLPARSNEVSFEMDGNKLSKIGLKPSFTINQGVLEILNAIS